MIIENNTINSILESFKKDLKSDFDVYKNHVYRIYNFALILDKNKDNHQKYAIAAAFHDIGIWTHSFDYLAPSIKLASKYLTKINQTAWTDEIALMINNHHKISTYHGEHAKTVEVFRRADWVDVVKGIKLFGLNKSDYTLVKKEFTNKGFHKFLIRETFNYFIKHPLNPLPMFKK